MFLLTTVWTVGQHESPDGCFKFYVKIKGTLIWRLSVVLWLLVKLTSLHRTSHVCSSLYIHLGEADIAVLSGVLEST